MEQIILAYGVPKETVTAIMMFRRNPKIKVCSPDGDPNFFDIVAGVLQGDTLAPYLFIICLDYVRRTSIYLIKENSFTHKNKTKSRRYPAETITDAYYADNIALRANTPTQVKSLLHSLEQAVRDIGLHMNAGKTKNTSSNKERNISALNEISWQVRVPR